MYASGRASDSSRPKALLASDMPSAALASGAPTPPVLDASRAVAGRGGRRATRVGARHVRARHASVGWAARASSRSVGKANFGRAASESVLCICARVQCDWNRLIVMCFFYGCALHAVAAASAAAAGSKQPCRIISHSPGADSATLRRLGRDVVVIGVDLVQQHLRVARRVVPHHVLRIARVDGVDVRAQL